MAGSANATLIPNLKDLYESGLFSDLTIVCEEESFKVHKSILWSQSNYFRKLLGGRFKEANATTLELPETAAVMSVMLRYFYHFTLNDASRPLHMSKSCFIIAVYATADKYDVPHLRTMAALRFDQICSPADVDDFLAAIRMVDENTAEQTLLRILLPKVKDSLPRLMELDEFRTLMMDIPSFTFQLVSYLGSGGMLSTVPDTRPTPDDSTSDYDLPDAPEVAFGLEAWGSRRRGPGRRLG